MRLQALHSTLFTVMKPLESKWMPLCFRNPVAGMLPAEWENKKNTHL